MIVRFVLGGEAAGLLAQSFAVCFLLLFLRKFFNVSDIRAVHVI